MWEKPRLGTILSLTHGIAFTLKHNGALSENNERDVKMACQSLLQISHCPLASGHMFGCSFLEVYELPGTFFTSWFTTDMRHPDIHGFWQKIYHWHHTICCSRTNRSYCRGDTYMMSTKFAQFLTPPCLVAYRIHATLFPLSFFWGPPSTQPLRTSCKYAPILVTQNPEILMLARFSWIDQGVLGEVCLKRL